MKISDFLREERIQIGIKAKNKETAIKEVGELLRNADEIIDYNQFLKDVFERERLNTTGIGNGVGIPHARTDSVKQFVIAIGISSEGIDFEALDKNPVKIIFLMGTPKQQGINDYLKILAHLTRLIQRESFLQKLISADSSSAIIAAFKEVEKIEI